MCVKFMVATDQQFAAVIVAHPDDESLWCGGAILEQPWFSWHVVTLCRASDSDRAPRFRRVMQRLGATGDMGDLDDGPEQIPLDPSVIQADILKRLPAQTWDRVYTHGPQGEYTRHVRHEECCRAVLQLWQSGAISTRELWMFAYTDKHKRQDPLVRDDAKERSFLTDVIFQQKREIITDLYGFGPSSWEARIVPREEGFWRFQNYQAASIRIDRFGAHQ